MESRLKVVFGLEFGPLQSGYVHFMKFCPSKSGLILIVAEARRYAVGSRLQHDLGKEHGVSLLAFAHQLDSSC